MGQGPPDVWSAVDFEPTTGDLWHALVFETRFSCTREHFNTLHAAAQAAGGMSNIPAAYSALRTAAEALETGRGAWLDRNTTGGSQTETDLLRRGVVWQYVSRGTIPAPPQP